MTRIHSARANTRATIVAVFAASLSWAQGAQADPTSAIDTAALQSIAKSNAATFAALEAAMCANERAAINAGAQACKDSACVIALAAISALAPCSIVSTRQMHSPTNAPVPTIINAAPPPTVGERIITGIGYGLSKLFDVGIALGAPYMQMKLGIEQSRNTTTLAMRQSDNALGATQSTNATFAAFGNNIQGTANAGFGATTNIATTGFATATTLGQRVTNVTNVSGTGNATNGSSVATTTTTTTSTNNCPAGDGGNGTNSGQAGTGPGGAGGAANCTAGK